MICEDCKVKDECLMYEGLWKKQLSVIKELRSDYSEYGIADHIKEVIDNYDCDFKE